MTRLAHATGNTFRYTRPGAAVAERDDVVVSTAERTAMSTCRLSPAVTAMTDDLVVLDKPDREHYLRVVRTRVLSREGELS